MSDRTYVTLVAPDAGSNQTASSVVDAAPGTGQQGIPPAQGVASAQATTGSQPPDEGAADTQSTTSSRSCDVSASKYDAPASVLRVAGLTQLSTCDWPGKLAATVFLQGCPWKCAYCHNYELQDPRADGTIPWDDIVSFLNRRRGLLDAVVFSGGEPTMQNGLADAMRQVRELGFAVGLHTGGPYPRRLAAVLPLVDWIGLDIKATAAKYEAVTGKPNSARKAFQALDLIQSAGVDFEVRTTVDPTVLTDDDVAEIQQDLARRGVTMHVIQKVRDEGSRPEYQAALAELRQE